MERQEFRYGGCASYIPVSIVVAVVPFSVSWLASTEVTGAQKAAFVAIGWPFLLVGVWGTMRLLLERIVLKADALEHRNWIGKTDLVIPYEQIVKIETKLGTGRSPGSYTIVASEGSLTFDESLLGYDRLIEAIQAKRRLAATQA